MGLARCDIHEDDQDLSARFMGGLNRDIRIFLIIKNGLDSVNYIILL